MTVRRALLSVSDKQGIGDFSKKLVNLNISLISTGGTAKTLQQNNVPYEDISAITGFPEMLDGRVKTLHPHIHGALLAQRKNKAHMNTLKDHHIKPIDMVVCNLYPFENTIAKQHVSLEEIIENIDIGGPTLIRAAAKNYPDIVVITTPLQYNHVISLLEKEGDINLAEREQLALDAFSHTAQYDAIISSYLRSRWTNEILHENNAIAIRKIQDMRYGENPHQKGAFYKIIPETTEPCITNAFKLQGKILSYNNILDADCAIEAIKEFNEPACVIIKHATPCGIANGKNLMVAWKDAFSTDTYSPFGGIVSFNRTVGKQLAKELSTLFLEVIIAPGYTSEAIDIFGQKKNLRLLEIKDLTTDFSRKGMIYRSVVGGMLSQERDVGITPRSSWKIATKKKPTQQQLISMEFAVKCVKHIKSNSIVFVKETRTVGIGGGQTARVDAAWIATHKGKENIKDSILASDAFFPFRDAVDIAAKAGVRAIIQPGGSIRDEEVISAADEHNITMVFSGQRYFRH
ncbi:bifunctional phosphoribosylaminoimidazolecarboxamide formyltransferase/IMP cyclohydrolase [Pseudomonadota bacterium]